MFEFMKMLLNREERAVARYEDEEASLIVDTCAVSGSDQPYETGVSHPAYNGGKWVIVQMYETHGEAEAGHDVWVMTMTADELPADLKDVSTAIFAKILREFEPEALVNEFIA